MLPGMSRIAIETMLRALDGAYRSDPFHALLLNLQAVDESDWTSRPVEHREDVFGDDPELSIGDIVVHVAGALRMWTNHGFGDGTMQWGEAGAELKSRSKADVLAFLEGGVQLLIAAVSALPNDSALDALTKAPGGTPIPARHVVAVMTNHMLYHSGELNRQRSIMRGAAGGWTSGG